jgi:3-hydroxyacyl-CoA dehydrogenase
MSTVKSVGVVGTGVIGASWTALFLSQGLQVLVSDPAPDAEEKLSSYLKMVWPTLEIIGLASGASISNYRFVGSSLEKYYGEVDFIQEVSTAATLSCQEGRCR